MTNPYFPSGTVRNRRKWLIALAAASAFSSLSPLHAEGTLAGTEIENIASASHDAPDGTVTIDSNPVAFTVDELLDVTIASNDTADIGTAPGATEQVLSFTATNTGNGSEAFELTANPTNGGDDFDPSIDRMVIDSNSNGVYDPGVDETYVAGSNDPLLDPDKSIVIFVLTTIPNTATDGDRAEVTLTATAKTGSGNPGTTFDGAGEGGGDAIVGSTGATAPASGFYAISAASVRLVKTATIADPFGGTGAVRSSVITYSLIAQISGTGSVTGLIVTDPIPEGTSYVADSLKLGGNVLTDQPGDDAGTFNGNAITVTLGTVPGGEDRTVTFQVTID